jgi:two-component system chemotaxis sensor kinase CheA
MKLTLRFLLLVFALLVAVGASERQGQWALNRMDTALQRVVDSDMERVFAITHVRRLFRSMVVLEGDYLLAKTDADRQSMDKKMLKLRAEQLEQIDKYERLMPEADRQALTDIRLVRERWLDLNDKVRKLAATDHDAALAMSKLHAKDSVNWETVIGSLVTLSEKRLAAQVAEAKVIHQQATRNLLFVAFGAVAVAVGLGYFIFRGIRRNLLDLVSLNSGLEELVNERTAALTAREQSLRLILDSTGEAFLELHRDGLLTGVASAAALRWFGECHASHLGASYLFPNNEHDQKVFTSAFSQLVDDILPWELTVEQMPRRIQLGELTLELDYRQVFEGGAFAKVLVVARDISARVQSESMEKHAREQQTVLGKLLSDKAGFVQFVSDCETLISALSNSNDLQQTKRTLHTLKGNTAVYGMTSMAEECHRLEDLLAASGELLPAGKVADLETLWRSKLQSIKEFLSGVGENVLEIDSDEHQQLIDSLMKRRDYQEILSMVETWSWARASERLARLRAHTEYVAKRLGKHVDVVVEHNDIRLPNEYLQRFWPTLIHVVRNAVGHGIEDAGVRTNSGKPARAIITLATRREDDCLVIEIRDDGKGIDESAVMAQARERGIPLPANPSLVDVVTADGFTTSQEATDVSGRGVGLSAVRLACEADGGQIALRTQAGQGATFQFRFRMPVVKTGGLAAKLERRWSLMPEQPRPTGALSSETLPIAGLRKSS